MPGPPVTAFERQIPPQPGELRPARAALTTWLHDVGVEDVTLPSSLKPLAEDFADRHGQGPDEAEESEGGGRADNQTRWQAWRCGPAPWSRSDVGSSRYCDQAGTRRCAPLVVAS